MTLAKALANGLPLGAMLATDEVAEAFGPGSHATTFGGGPVITAAGLAVCQVFENDRIVATAAETGAYFKWALTELAAQCPLITEVRGLGLMLGVSLTVPAGPVVTACMEKGFLINAVQDQILRFVPPLIITKEDIDRLIATLESVLNQNRHHG
jgi:acetylornithine/succinyldiaminopimelate/putrescine aminotransferase